MGQQVIIFIGSFNQRESVCLQGARRCEAAPHHTSSPTQGGFLLVGRQVNNRKKWREGGQLIRQPGL